MFEGVRWSTSDDRQESSFACISFVANEKINPSIITPPPSVPTTLFQIPRHASVFSLHSFLETDRLISPLSLSPSPVGGNQPQRTGNRSNPLVHPTCRDKRRKCLLTRGAVESVSHLYLSVVGRGTAMAATQADKLKIKDVVP